MNQLNHSVQPVQTSNPPTLQPSNHHPPRPSFLIPISSILILLTLLTGCRREDVREYTFTIPGLTEKSKTQVVEALAKYNGVRKDSYVWDLDRKTLTLKYDSMQIARTNIRMAIEAKGVQVDFPTNTTGKAGYVDTHE